MKNDKSRKFEKNQRHHTERPGNDDGFLDAENGRKAWSRKKSDRRSKPAHKNMFWDD